MSAHFGCVVSQNVASQEKQWMAFQGFIHNQFFSLLQLGQNQPKIISTSENYEIVDILTPSDGYDVLSFAITDDLTEESGSSEFVTIQASFTPQPPSHQTTLIEDPLYYNTMYPEKNLQLDYCELEL